jgi:hypothetical protein
MDGGEIDFAMSSRAARLTERVTLAGDNVRIRLASHTLEWDLVAAGNWDLLLQALEPLRPQVTRRLHATLATTPIDIRAAALVEATKKIKGEFAQSLVDVLTGTGFSATEPNQHPAATSDVGNPQLPARGHRVGHGSPTGRDTGHAVRPGTAVDKHAVTDPLREAGPLVTGSANAAALVMLRKGRPPANEPAAPSFSLNQRISQWCRASGQLRR